MARPAEFDRDFVLEQATRTFLRRGYAATSMKNLTEVTRLNPGSLYAAFKSKRGLFKASIDHYFSQRLELIDNAMAKGQGIEAVYAFFDAVIEECEEDAGHDGCMILNSIVELAAHDCELREYFALQFDQIEQRMASALQATDLDAAATAQCLMITLHGMRVYSTSDRHKQGLRDIVYRQLGSLLKSATC